MIYAVDDMLTLSKIRFSAGIVPRLRAVFFAISVVLVAAAITGFGQIRNLHQSIDQLTVTSIFTFDKSEEVERGLKNLLLFLKRVDATSQLINLGPLYRDVAAQIAYLKIKTAELGIHSGSVEVTDQMKSALLEIETITKKIFVIKRSIYRHNVVIERIVEKLKEDRSLARMTLEELSYVAAGVADAIGQPRNLADLSSIEALEQMYRRKLAVSNTITSVYHEIEAVIDSAVRLNNFSNSKDLESAEKGIRFKIRNVVVLAGQLPDNGEREELTKAIIEIRLSLFGQDGIIREVAEIQALWIELEKVKLEQISPMEEISDLSFRLMSAARGKINSTRIELAAVTDRMTAILALAAFLALSTIAAAMILIVERQINRRMASLTRAVLAIAEGQTGYEVEVSGPDELGKMASALGVFKVNADELRRSNIDLERFAYAAAHDLRSPLRAIQDLTEWTLEDTDNVFSSDGRENMSLLQRRIGRLNRLLTDLLEYSRVGKDGSELVSVSIAEIVQDTADMLDPERIYDITFSGSCDFVTTLETPLRQILLNLINNAIKHHDRPRGKISVEAHQLPGRFTCSVSDDGPGIEPKYHKRIFGLFETLSPRDEVEGSGLGLAIICKSLESNDGSIVVQSDPKLCRGTKFIFNLPEKTGELNMEKKAA